MAKDVSERLFTTVSGVPIEELLFFVVVPLASILTLEAVRSVRGWGVGDEPRPKSQSRST